MDTSSWKCGDHCIVKNVFEDMDVSGLLNETTGTGKKFFATNRHFPNVIYHVIFFSGWTLEKATITARVIFFC